MSTFPKPDAVTASAVAKPEVSWPWVTAALLAHTGWGIHPVLSRYLQVVSSLPSMSILVVGTLPVLLMLFFHTIPRYGVRVFGSRLIWIMGGVVVIRAITNLLSARFTLAIYVQLIALMTPFVVVIMSRLLLGERAPANTGRAITLSSIGALLMMSAGIGATGLTFDFTPGDWLGIGLALASSVSLAVYMIVIRGTARQHIPGDAVFVFQSVAILVSSLLISLILGEDWSQWARNSPTDWAVVAAYVFFVIIGANALQIGALRHLGAPLVSSMMGWRLVSALTVAWLLLGERLTSIWQLLGALLVLVTITWYLWKQRRK